MHKDVECIHTYISIYIYIYIYMPYLYMNFHIYIYELPWWLSDKESICLYRRWRNVSHIPGSGRSLGEENGKPLQYTCWENPMDRGAWRATVHGVSKSKIWLSTHTPSHTHTYTHNGILLSYKKEWNNAICSNMDGPRDCHSKWSKSEKGQIPGNITCMWNLNNDMIYL